MLILLDKSSGAFHDNIFNWTVLPLALHAAHRHAAAS